MKITVDYYNGQAIERDALEAERIQVYPTPTFLEVILSEGISGGATYEDPLAETVVQKTWKVWYPIHSVLKVVTE